MRQGPGGRRPRGRPHRKQHGGPSRPNSFDSSGPEGRIRGNAHQVYEKYVGLARDALSSGDRISAEAYFQHAEHYFRIVNSSTDPETTDRRPARHDGNGRDPGARDLNDRHAGTRGSQGSQGQEARTAGTDESGAGRNAGDGGSSDGGSSESARDGAKAEAPSGDSQAAPQAGGRGQQEDREGLDRVLGRDGGGARQRSPRRAASPDRTPAEGPSDREAGSESTRRPTRPTRARRNKAETEAREPATAQPGPSGNGHGQPGADGDETSPSKDEAESAGPVGKTSGREPAGA